MLNVRDTLRKIIYFGTHEEKDNINAAIVWATILITISSLFVLAPGPMYFSLALLSLVMSVYFGRKLPGIYKKYRKEHWNA